jgi:hypothetical protein
MRAAREALAPRQTDESHLVIREVEKEGDVLQHSEEWTHQGAGLKVVQKETRVKTCTGEVVKPKEIRLQCKSCGGYDSVVTHCECGVAVCRRCRLPHPADSSPVCPTCYRLAIENFDVWAAHDRQLAKKDSKNE